MKFIDTFARLFGAFIALLRGQILIFPRANYKKLRIYGKVTIRGIRRNVYFGRNVTFMGDATVICGYDASCGRIYINDDVIIEHNTYLNAHGGNINISNGVFIGVSSIIQGKGGVNIGRNSMLGPNVQIYSSDHQTEIGNIPYIEQPELSSSVTIGENVWVGAGSIILRGSIISSNSVVAAGSILKIKTKSPSFIYRANGLANSLRELS